jgi:hypothetical protein
MLIKDHYNNEFLLFYRSGAGHLGKTGNISLLRSQDGMNWTDQGTIAKDNTDIRNPAACILDDGTGYLAALRYDAYHGEKSFVKPESKHNKLSIKFYRSKNSHLNWQEDPTIKVIHKDKIMSPFGKIIKYKNKLILPVYNGRDFASMLISNNQGKSWDEIHRIAFGYLEPSICVAPDGHLISALRANNHIIEGKGTWISHSYNDGISWTNPQLISEGNSHPADLITLSNGHILLTVGARNANKQRILAYISKDNGHTWNKYNPLVLSKIYKNCDFGYPSTVENNNGELFTAYYAHPDANIFFDFNDEKRYSASGATAFIIRYTLDKLINGFNKLNKNT